MDAKMWPAARMALYNRETLAKWQATSTAALLVLFLFAPLPAFAQTNEELKQENREMKQELEAIKAEMEEFKKLLRQRAGFQPTEVSVAGSHFLGDRNAKITLIEFTDYECPFCAKHVLQVMPRLIKDYVETGKLKYVIRDFPLVTVHTKATKSAEIALCAGDQGQFWEVHDKLFENQRSLQSKDMTTLLEAVGLDVKKVQECLNTGKYTSKVQNDIKEGRKVGVRGTPTFLLGLTEPNASKIKATKLLKGAMPYAQFKAVIDNMLSAKVGGG